MEKTRKTTNLSAIGRPRWCPVLMLAILVLAGCQPSDDEPAQIAEAVKAEANQPGAAQRGLETVADEADETEAPKPEPGRAHRTLGDVSTRIRLGGTTIGVPNHGPTIIDSKAEYDAYWVWLLGSRPDIDFNDEVIFVLLDQEGSGTHRPRYEFELDGETLKVIVRPAPPSGVETMDIKKYGVALAVSRDRVKTVEVHQGPRPQATVRSGAFADMNAPRLEVSLLVGTSSLSEEQLKDYVEVIEQLREIGVPEVMPGAYMRVQRN